MKFFLRKRFWDRRWGKRPPPQVIPSFFEFPRFFLVKNHFFSIFTKMGGFQILGLIRPPSFGYLKLNFMSVSMQYKDFEYLLILIKYRYSLRNVISCQSLCIWRVRTSGIYFQVRNKKKIKVKWIPHTSKLKVLNHNQAL